MSTSFLSITWFSPFILLFNSVSLNLWFIWWCLFVCFSLSSFVNSPNLRLWVERTFTPKSMLIPIILFSLFWCFATIILSPNYANGLCLSVNINLYLFFMSYIIDVIPIDFIDAIDGLYCNVRKAVLLISRFIILLAFFGVPSSASFANLLLESREEPSLTLG